MRTSLLILLTLLFQSCTNKNSNNDTINKKILVGGIRAELRPDGAVTLSSATTDFQSISLTGKVVRNPNDAQNPYGYAIALN